MVEVKIREKTESIKYATALGTELGQPHSYLQLYFPESGKVVPNDIYILKQGEREEMCNVTGGQARGVEWTDRNQAMFLKEAIGLR